MLNQLTDEKLQRLVDKFGVTVDWYPSRLCSCIAENNGVRNPNCPCIGGYYYDESTRYMLLRNRIRYNTLTQEYGVLLQGGAAFTIPRYEIIDGAKRELAIFKRIARGDVLVVPKYNHRDTDFLTRGVRDSVWAFDIEDIQAISQENVVFKEGIDYSFVDVDIIWHSSGNVPRQETIYAVEFTASQQFIVWDDSGSYRGTDAQQLARNILTRMRPYGSLAKNPIDNVDLKQETF